MISIGKQITLFFVLTLFVIGTLPLSSALIDVTINLTYDRNGNLMQDANYYYQYNSEHQLSKVRDKNATGRILAAYWYDGNGQRLKRVVFHDDGSNTTTYYIHDDFVREIGPDGIARDTVYYRDLDGTLLARKDPDGKKYFYHPDALGSTALVTDEAGNVVEEVEYLPFGEVIEGGNDRYLFTGKEKDRETGLQYYNTRYYAPDQARFIQPDSVQPNVYDPQQLNKYSYARNNPVKYTDPSGHTIWDVADFAFIGLDYKTYRENPTVTNAVFLGISVISLAPILPNIAGYARYGDEAVKGGSNLLRSAKAVDKVQTTAKVIEGINKANDVAKASKRVYSGVNKADTLKYVRESGQLSEPVAKAANHFFKGSKQSASTNLNILDMGNGKLRFEFFDPAKNIPGQGKQYVRIIDAQGNVIDSYRYTQKADGTIGKITFKYQDGIKLDKDLIIGSDLK